MENLVILTKENINEYDLTESTHNDVLTYDDENLINTYSHFQFSINPDTKQLYARHIVLGRVKDWGQSPFTPKN